jgi:hypothetical protein
MEGVAMTQVSCPICRLRFTDAAAVHLDTCPECATPTQPMTAESVVGFRLAESDDDSQLWPVASAVALRDFDGYPRD